MGNATAREEAETTTATPALATATTTMMTTETNEVGGGGGGVVGKKGEMEVPATKKATSSTTTTSSTSTGTSVIIVRCSSCGRVRRDDGDDGSSGRGGGAGGGGGATFSRRQANRAEMGLGPARCSDCIIAAAKKEAVDDGRREGEGRGEDGDGDDENVGEGPGPGGGVVGSSSGSGSNPGPTVQDSTCSPRTSDPAAGTTGGVDADAADTPAAASPSRSSSGEGRDDGKRKRCRSRRRRRAGEGDDEQEGFVTPERRIANLREKIRRDDTWSVVYRKMRTDGWHHRPSGGLVPWIYHPPSYLADSVDPTYDQVTLKLYAVRNLGWEGDEETTRKKKSKKKSKNKKNKDQHQEEDLLPVRRRRAAAALDDDDESSPRSSDDRDNNNGEDGDGKNGGEEESERRGRLPRQEEEGRQNRREEDGGDGIRRKRKKRRRRCYFSDGQSAASESEDASDDKDDERGDGDDDDDDEDWSPSRTRRAVASAGGLRIGVGGDGSSPRRTLLLEERSSDEEEGSSAHGYGYHGAEVSLAALKRGILGRDVITSHRDGDDSDSDGEESDDGDDGGGDDAFERSIHVPPGPERWSSSEEVNMLRKELKCPICHDVLYGPVTVPCGHSFCRACIDWWLTSRRSSSGTSSNRLRSEGSSDSRVNCPTCRRGLDTNLVGSLGVNTALRAVVSTLYREDVKPRIEAERRARDRATRGEDGGAHDRGYEVISNVEDQPWRQCRMLLPNGNEDEFMGVRRSVVLDANDQRMHLALSIVPSCDWGASIDDDSRNGGGRCLLEICLCMLSMEEDEASDESGFPVMMIDEDDNCLICGGAAFGGDGDTRFVSTTVAVTARLVEAAPASCGRESAAAAAAPPVPLTRCNFDEDGMANFRIDLAGVMMRGNAHGAKRSGDRTLNVTFRHEETGATMEVRLPPTALASGGRRPRNVGGGRTGRRLGGDEGAVSRRADDDEEEEEDDDGSHLDEYEDDGFLVVGEGNDGDDRDEDDLCKVCGDGGELMVCDGGDELDGGGKSFHVGCVNRAEVPPGDWICGDCARDELGLSTVGIEGYEFDAADEADGGGGGRGDNDDDRAGNAASRIGRLKRRNRGLSGHVDDSDEGEFEETGVHGSEKMGGVDPAGDDDDSDESLEVLAPATGRTSKRSRICDSDEDEFD